MHPVVPYIFPMKIALPFIVCHPERIFLFAALFAWCHILSVHWHNPCLTKNMEVI